MITPINGFDGVNQGWITLTQAFVNIKGQYMFCYREDGKNVGTVKVIQGRDFKKNIFYASISGSESEEKFIQSSFLEIVVFQGFPSVQIFFNIFDTRFR